VVHQSALDTRLLDNPVCAALDGPHAGFAERLGRAARYRTLAQCSTLQGGGVGHPAGSGPEGHSGMAKIALSDNGVVGPTAGRAGSQACGGRVRPTLTGRRWPVKQEPVVVPRSGTDRNLPPSGRRGRQPADVYALANPAAWADLHQSRPPRPGLGNLAGPGGGRRHQGTRRDPVPARRRPQHHRDPALRVARLHPAPPHDHPSGAHPRNRRRGAGVVSHDEARAGRTGGRDVCIPYLRLHIDLQRVAGALCRP